MNKGAFTGNHGAQLEDIFKILVESEQKSGKTLTDKDFTDIRFDISQAYDEIINCFDKENADESIVTYAINLMKSTVSSTNDLRNISQIAVAVSQSTIGALYLVNSLKEMEQAKFKNLDLVNNFLNNDSKKTIEELTSKIEFNINPSILEEIGSEENEKAYSELQKRADNGDMKAQITLCLIRKSANLIYNKQAGFYKPEKEDTVGLITIGKLCLVGEEVALTNAQQVIKEFDLERYDIYDLDENGDKVLSTKKIREALQKNLDAQGMDKKAEDLISLKREIANIGIIEQFNDETTNKTDGSLRGVYKYAELTAGVRKFNGIYAEILDRLNANEITLEEYVGARERLVEENYYLAKESVKFDIDFKELYGDTKTSSSRNDRIFEISEICKRFTSKSQPEEASKKTGFEEYTEKIKYEKKIDINQINNQYPIQESNKKSKNGTPIIPEDDERI